MYMSAKVLRVYGFVKQMRWWGLTAKSVRTKGTEPAIAALPLGSSIAQDERLAS
jgi:hypothetical protein